MSKSFTFITVVATIDIMLSIFGVVTTLTGGLLEAINFGTAGGFKFGEFYTLIFADSTGLFAIGAAVATIIAGLYFRGEGESALMAGITSVIGGWVIADLIMIISKAGTMFPADLFFMVTIIRFLVSLIFIGVVISLIQLWRGND